MEKKDMILSIRNLSVNYSTEDGDVKAVRDVSFDLERGKTIGLVGETGAGKTTIALTIMGLLPEPPAKVISGEVEYNGTDVFRMSPKKRTSLRGSQMSMIFQDPMTSLNPIETVGSQITEAILNHNKISRAEARMRAVDKLEMVGIPGERFDEYPHQFSGGMKQRIVIAIALACNPELLIADEPTTALDVTIQAQILALLKRLNREMGMSILFISHNLHVVRKLCTRVAVMEKGRIVETGPVDQIFFHPQAPYTQRLIAAIPTRRKL